MQNVKIPVACQLPRDLPETPFVAMFTIDVFADRRTDFLVAMEQAMSLSAMEAGVASFLLLADRDDPNRFTAIDIYCDREGFDAHLVAPQTALLTKELEGCLQRPPQATFHHRLADKDDFLRDGENC